MITKTYDELVFKLVPIEPTPQMLINVDEDVGGHCYECTAWRASDDDCRRVYAAMLAAAPTPPTEQPTEMLPYFTDTARAALLWVLWHHQGGSSSVGQPIRFALGMGAHDHLSPRQIAEAKRWNALPEEDKVAEPKESMPVMGGRESLDDALAIVESFGPGIEGLNDTYARQIILADEIKRLRGLYESAVQGRRDFREALREQQGEQEPVGWFQNTGTDTDPLYEQLADEFKNEPDAIALYTHPTPSLAALRAKVEALPHVRWERENYWKAKDVLAEIDKLGGKV